VTNEAMNHRKNQGDKWKQKYNYPKPMDAAKAVVLSLFGLIPDH